MMHTKHAMGQLLTDTQSTRTHGKEHKKVIRRKIEKHHEKTAISTKEIMALLRDSITCILV